MANSWRAADALTGLRLLLLPILWLAALNGHGRLVGAGLVVAGATDFLDGYLARRLGQATAAGARLDSIADTLLLLSAAVWIQLLHPEIARENTVLIAATFALYLASITPGLVKFHRLANLHLYSSKVAGAFLYTFALATLLTGGYEPLLLMLAAVALIASSAETLISRLVLRADDESMGSVVFVLRRRAETSTVHANGIARKQRSQAPHAEKVVGSNANPTINSAAVAAPRTIDRRP